MLAVLPPILPDESIGDYCMRVAPLNGYDSVRRLFASVFGAAWLRFDRWLPRAIASFSAEIGRALGSADPEHWIYEHTAYRYFAAFLPPERRAQLFARMLSTRSGAVRPVQMLSYTEYMPGQARACRRCMAADDGRYGVSVVRLSHNLPYVTRCAIHGDRLVHIAQNGALEAPKIASEVTEEADANSRQFSRWSSTFLAGNATGPEGAQQTAWIELSRAERRSRLEDRFLDTVIERWQRGFESPELNLLLAQRDTLSRCLRTFLYTERRRHPVIGILLADTLLARTRANSKTGNVNCAQGANTGNYFVNPAPHPRGPKKLPDSYRPKVLKANRLQEVCEALGSGKSVAAVARTSSLSLSTVYRVLRRFPKLAEEIERVRSNARLEARRERWLALRSAHPALGIKELRAMSPADYAFLYRRDRAALQMPRKAAKPAVHPKSRIAIVESKGVLLERLTDAGTSLALEGDSRPTRVTANRILRAAGFSEDNLKTFRHLGTVNEAIARQVDTRTQFVNRRLCWAAKQVQIAHGTRDTWRVKRLASLRPETVRLAAGDEDFDQSGVPDE